MIDQELSPQNAPRLRWRERALRETRHRLQHLQIEIHRVKADLARLESANEMDLANQLAEELNRSVEQAVGNVPTPQLLATPHTRHVASRVDLSSGRKLTTRSASGNIASASTRATIAEPTPPEWRSAKPIRQRRSKSKSRALQASLGLHFLLLLLIAPLSYVIVTHERLPLFASMFGPEVSDVADPGTGPIELVSFEEFEAPGDVVEPVASLPQSESEAFGPFEDVLSGDPAPQFGQLNSLPTDVGTLMAGGGSGSSQGLPGGGGRGAASDEARLGMTNFFGTPARANRVVFLVDNSGSMKQGRMETTLLELARSIEALGEKQEFYVVFYSDQAYPMFYPHSEMSAVPATRENKQRLYRWLQTVELCVGGALLKAVEIAESLEPQVVYVLSDGNITSQRTLEQLTQPSGRKFALHTLGMGVAKPQDAQNLAAIAAAHHGTFQMVRPLPAAVQMAKARPIRSNSFGVAWGAAALAPLR
ncbi:MAG: VWA domain-containing protein [Pirellulales bacterium]